jgi:cation:H+ antiporter
MLIVLFVLGLMILSVGAELFVRGASNSAAKLGISPLIIGLTVVAFGTSAPELAVVINAGFEGQGDLAFGNIVGSNISNFLLILGITALISPLVVSHHLIKMEVPFLLGVSVLVYYFSFNGLISTLEGGLLFTIAIIYTFYLVYSCLKLGDCGESDDPTDTPASKAKPSPSKKDAAPDPTAKAAAPVVENSWKMNLLLLISGLVGLVLGAHWLVNGASGIARALGVSELIIGLTMVAVGTSLPELATAVAAGLRGERDIVIGNIIGSNLFNLLFVLGLSAFIIPGGLGVPPSGIAFDLPVMLAVTAASLPIFFSGYRIKRWEGLLFLSYYGAYILYLFLFSVEHDFLPAYSTFMLQYILPATAFMLVFVLARAVRANGRGRLEA